MKKQKILFYGNCQLAVLSNLFQSQNTEFKETYEVLKAEDYKLETIWEGETGTVAPFRYDKSNLADSSTIEAVEKITEEADVIIFQNLNASPATGRPAQLTTEYLYNKYVGKKQLLCVPSCYFTGYLHPPDPKKAHFPGIFTWLDLKGFNNHQILKWLKDETVSEIAMLIAQEAKSSITEMASRETKDSRLYTNFISVLGILQQYREDYIVYNRNHPSSKYFQELYLKISNFLSLNPYPLASAKDIKCVFPGWVARPTDFCFFRENFLTLCESLEVFDIYNTRLDLAYVDKQLHKTKNFPFLTLEDKTNIKNTLKILDPSIDLNFIQQKNTTIVKPFENMPSSVAETAGLKIISKDKKDLVTTINYAHERTIEDYIAEVGISVVPPAPTNKTKNLHIFTAAPALPTQLHNTYTTVSLDSSVRFGEDINAITNNHLNKVLVLSHMHNNNYAHVLCEVLPLLLYFSELDPTYSSLITYKTKILTGILDALQLKLSEKIIFIEDSYKFTCKTLTFLPVEASANMPRDFKMLTYLYKKIKSLGIHKTKANKLIYCSRPKEAVKHGRTMQVENEKEILLRLQKYCEETKKYELVVFDGLDSSKNKWSVLEQIKLFSEAKCIMGPHGSALYNLIFSPQDLTVCEFTGGTKGVLKEPTFIDFERGTFRDYYALKDYLDYYYIPFDSTQPLTSLTIDLDNLEMFLKILETKSEGSPKLLNRKHTELKASDFLPTIYTYYDYIGKPNQEELLDLWKFSWEKQGFRAVVLQASDAAKHPYYKEFEVKLKQLHLDIAGEKLKLYGLSCYLRWLAYAAQTSHPDGNNNCSFLVSDYDVINVNFKPSDLPKPGDKLNFLAKHCPCLAYATPAQFLEFCENVVNFSEKNIEEIKRKYIKKSLIHYHDQEFLGLNAEALSYNFSGASEYVELYVEGEDNSARLVHVAHKSAGDAVIKFPELKNITFPELRVRFASQLLKDHHGNSEKTEKFHEIVKQETTKAYIALVKSISENHIVVLDTHKNLTLSLNITDKTSLRGGYSSLSDVAVGTDVGVRADYDNITALVIRKIS